MSLSKVGLPTGELVLQLPSGVEASILDADLSVVCRAVPGETRSVLPAGIYKAIARSGDSAESRLIEVIAGSSQTVSLDPIRYASAAPLTFTRKTHEYQVAAAQDGSRAAPKAMGNGARLFFFSRYWSGVGGQEKPPANVTHPLSGLTLHRPDGTQVVDLQEVGGWEQSVRDSFATAHVELDPGAYRLRLTTKAYGVIEQMVALCAGWQTQVFTLVRDVDPGPPDEFLSDLTTASILMARANEGFIADSQLLRLADVARLGLARRRPLLSPADRQVLLDAKFDNPMLGIMGAYLIAREESDSSRLAPLVSTLMQLAGDHPDVRVLASAFLPGANVGHFETPPMLAAAWEVLTDRAATDDELIPADSFSSAVAVAKWGTGAWLSWLLDELPSVAPARLPQLAMAAAGDVPVDATLPSNPTMLNADLSSSFERVRQQLNLVEQRRDRLNVLERAVADAMQSGSVGKFHEDFVQFNSESAPSQQEGEFNVPAIAKAFKLPASSVRSVLSNIANKLAE